MDRLTSLLISVREGMQWLVLLLLVVAMFLCLKHCRWSAWLLLVVVGLLGLFGADAANVIYLPHPDRPGPIIGDGLPSFLAVTAAVRLASWCCVVGGLAGVFADLRRRWAGSRSIDVSVGPLSQARTDAAGSPWRLDREVKKDILEKPDDIKN